MAGVKRTVLLVVAGAVVLSVVVGAGVAAREGTRLIVNGKPVADEVLVVKGRAYVPVRAVADALGVPVAYEPGTRTVRIGGAGAAGVVRAQRFELVDGQGKVMAELGVSRGCEPGLALRDKDGKVRGLLALAPTGEPFFQLRDEKVPRASLWVSETGAPGLSLRDEETRALSHLSVAQLVLIGKEEEGRISLSVPGKGGPRMLMDDEQGREAWSAP